MAEEDLGMARAIAERVKEYGGSTYYVGGFVRDRLLGKDNKDVDIEIHGIRPALICLSMADGRGKIPQRDGSAYDFLRERLAVYREYMGRPYVQGRDLIKAGLQPCAEFTDYLNFAHKLRLTGVEKERALQQTLAYARQNGAGPQ